MSDGLTAQPASPEHLDARPETAPSSPWVVVPAQALATVGVFAAAGAAAGWLWYKLWDKSVCYFVQSLYYIVEQLCFSSTRYKV